MPQRYQRSRKVGSKLPQGTLCVTRPSIWGNPYPPGTLLAAIPPRVCDLAGLDLAARDTAITQSMAVKLYAAYVKLHKRFLNLEMVRGKDLACWCAPGEPCHADALLTIANAPHTTRQVTVEITAADIAAANVARDDYPGEEEPDFATIDPLAQALVRMGYTTVYVAPSLIRCDQAYFQPSADATWLMNLFDNADPITPHPVVVEDIGYVE